MRLISAILLALILSLIPVAGNVPAVVARPLCLLAVQPAASDVPVYGYKIINSYPHDANAFTQGLLYEDGRMYESTGLHGRSSLRRVNLADGHVLQQKDLASNLFAEGIALVDDHIIQLTWQEQTALVYDQETFKLIDSFAYPTEGWGLTYDGERLFMSDGSDTLFFRDPDTFALLGSVQVRDGGQPVVRLNELEFVRGEIYANVWLTDRIARIDPASGQVLGWIDLTGLLSPAASATANVLNGIAYDADNDRLFVTGKLWPKLFEIRLVPPRHYIFCPRLLA